MTTETKRILVQTALTQQDMVPLNYACGDMRNTMPFVLLADGATVIFKLVTAGEGFYRCEVVLRDDDLEARVEKLKAALQRIVDYVTLPAGEYEAKYGRNLIGLTPFTEIDEEQAAIARAALDE